MFYTCLAVSMQLMWWHGTHHGTSDWSLRELSFQVQRGEIWIQPRCFFGYSACMHIYMLARNSEEQILQDWKWDSQQRMRSVYYSDTLTRHWWTPVDIFSYKFWKTTLSVDNSSTHLNENESESEMSLKCTNLELNLLNVTGHDWKLQTIKKNISL